MSASFILWAYVAVLVAGGLVGYLKAGSRISLLSSLGFAVPLSLCAAGKWPPIVAVILLGMILLVFIFRYLKTRAFIPAGLMAVLTTATCLGVLLTGVL